MAPAFHHVPLADIDPDDTTFIVTYRPAMQDLQRSVARVGVLTPLHLRRLSPHLPLQLVCGSKRLMACQQAGQMHLPALVYTAADLPEEQAFLLALYDNVGCRTLNPVEKARLLYRLRDHFGYQTPRLSTDFCPLLDLPPRPQTVDTYCRLATLEEPLQAAVVDGALPLETTLWIGAQSADDRQALLTLFTGVKFGSNRAKEVATFMDDICRRDGCGAAELLHHLGIPALLTDLQGSAPQKIAQIRQRLRQARYPQLSAYEQRFQEAVRRLRLPPQLTLQPPTYFEGERYHVAFTFGQRQELQQYAQRLLDVAHSDALETLLDLL